MCGDRQPARRQGRGAGPRGAPDRQRDRRVLGRERTWSPDALRKLVRAFADPEVAYVCGRLNILDAEGSNKEGVYWRYEMVQRAAESTLGSVTGGNGSIYALRRADYVEVDPRFGHDLSLPYLMVQRGRRAVYEPEAQRVREADADERDRVPPQGADVRALLADRAARQDVPAARPALPRSRSSRTACCATAPASCTSCCSRPRSRSSATAGLRRRARGQLAAARGRARRRRHRALLRARLVGDARRALELPAPRRPGDVGARRRARGEPRARRRDRRGRARRHEPVARAPARWRSSSRTAGRSSTGRPASARTASTSSC